MLSRAKSKYIRVSPFKLRPIADVIRGLSVERALSWLKTHAMKKTRPITKTLLSAVANIGNVETENVSPESLVIKEIRIDQGPTISYFKPGSMGRAKPQQKRMSHIEITVGTKSQASASVKKVEKKVVEKKAVVKKAKVTTVKKAKPVVKKVAKK